jgi:glycosyltransferase involved in cell wall biosynthesis
MPGCREVVTHGVNGFLVPPRDAGALAAAIADILSNPVLADTMGRESRRIAVEKFDERSVLESTLAVYSELLDLPAAPSEPA